MKEEVKTMKKLLIWAIGFVLLPAFTLMSGSFNMEEYDDFALSNYSIFAIDNVKIYRNSIINSGDVGVLNKGMMDVSTRVSVSRRTLSV